MDWSSIGTIAEVVGAFAVVVSLVYVGRQVRDNTRAMRSEGFRQASMTLAALLDNWAHDDQWIDLQGRIFGGLRSSDMTPLERGRAGLRSQAFLEYVLGIHWQVREGILPPSAYQLAGKPALETPYMREMWAKWRTHFPEHFVQALEAEYDIRTAA